MIKENENIKALDLIQNHYARLEKTNQNYLATNILLGLILLGSFVLILVLIVYNDSKILYIGYSVDNAEIGIRKIVNSENLDIESKDEIQKHFLKSYIYFFESNTNDLYQTQLKATSNEDVIEKNRFSRNSNILSTTSVTSITKTSDSGTWVAYIQKKFQLTTGINNNQNITQTRNLTVSILADFDCSTPEIQLKMQTDPTYRTLNPSCMTVKSYEVKDNNPTN